MAGQDLGIHGEGENQADAGHGSGLSSLPPPMTQESVITLLTVHLFANRSSAVYAGFSSGHLLRSIVGVAGSVIFTSLGW